jgi:uncharacterized protein
MHFYESSIITTKDGLHCQVYGNEHPPKSILVKPKYIPTDKVESPALQYRFISSHKMNRLNLWTDKDALKSYLSSFKESYPHYHFESSLHDSERIFFSVPIDKIERIYFPRRGLKELMSMPESSLDEHLKLVHSFVNFLLKSGLRLKDLGVTYSTLMGHYLSNYSDINIVVYGKENYWKMMEFLKNAEHPQLRWKNEKEWLQFRNKRNRNAIFDNENLFVKSMLRKKSEGFFGNTLFVIFAAEKEEEVWFKWNSEKYKSLGEATIECTISDNKSSVVRPGCYGVNEAVVVNGPSSSIFNISKVVFYSRDYCMIALPGERIKAHGLIEEVTKQDGSKYHRLVVGYFDSYVSDRREREFIKLIE